MTDVSALSQLDQLKQFTTVVADTGDFQTIREFAPQDATTNPTLILKAVEKDEYASLADKAVASCRDSGLSGQALMDAVASELLVLLGIEILNIIPGRVSTEVDARLSYDTEGTIAKAREIIQLYRSKGVDSNRFNLGGNQCRERTGKRRNTLQPNTSVFFGSGCSLCRI